jgi:D,D-heptose 1,7-bisphosphate phosphatase
VTDDRRRRALFLDRDGVINREHGYVHRRESFHFQPAIFELCRAAQALEYRIVVVTNQAGIARGYYTERQFLELTEWMIGEFVAHGLGIARVYYCVRITRRTVSGRIGMTLRIASRAPGCCCARRSSSVSISVAVCSSEISRRTSRPGKGPASGPSSC